MFFISIPIINLGRRPLRTFLTIMGIGVAVGSFIALIGMTRGLEKAWLNSLADRGTHMLATRKGAVEILTASIDDDMSDELGKAEGIRAVAGELLDLVTLESGQVVLIAGWQSGSFLWDTLDLIEGTLPRPGSSTDIVAGQAAAKALGLNPGDTLRIRDTEFTVSGIFRQGGVMTNGTIVFPLSVMQSLMGKPDTVTLFNLLVERPDDPEWIEALQTRLDNTFQELTFTETNQITESNQILKLFRAMSWGTSIIALIIALVFTLNTLLMAVTEQTREIGILSSVGWSSRRILSMVVLEGVILACIGSIAGSILGIYGLRYLAGLPQMHGFLEPEITTRLLLEVCGATLLLGILGSLYPAYRAISINTVEALRYE